MHGSFRSWLISIYTLFHEENRTIRYHLKIDRFSSYGLIQVQRLVMSGETRPGFPGWCCRQIAAQLSHALFTMADLHAQVSDLREENRQLKIKMENVDVRRSPEVDGSAECFEDSLCAKMLPETSSSSRKLRIEKSEKVECAVFKDEGSQHEEDSHDNHCINENAHISDPHHSQHSNCSSSQAVVLNVPLKHKHPNCTWDAPAGTILQFSGDFKCDKCESSFPNADLLTLHQAVHISRSFHVCKVCNAMFLLKADLYRHWASHPNIKQHVCHLCGKAYTSKNNYKLHIKTHTGVGLYPCGVCGKAFHSENHLNVHRRIHTGERPFVCQYCDKSFTQKSGLINHTRLHTGEKPFLCPSCPKAFTQKSNLNFHLSKHHPPS